jgi:hypothetical protein
VIRVDPRVPSGEWSHPANVNDNDDGKGEEDTQGGENVTGKRKGAKDGKGKHKETENRKGEEKATQKGKGKGNGNGNRNGKGIVKQTTVGESSQSSRKA